MGRVFTSTGGATPRTWVDTRPPGRVSGDSPEHSPGASRCCCFMKTVKRSGCAQSLPPSSKEVP